MKTMKHFSVLALLVATALCSCTDNDVTNAVDTNPNFPKDGVMRFTSSVTEAQTRVGMDNDNIKGSELLLWVTPEGEASPSYTYGAITLHYTEGIGWGTFMPESNSTLKPTTLLWKDKTTKVEVVAASIVTNERSLPVAATVSIYNNQTSANAITESDLLYFKGTVNPAATSDTEAEYALKDGKIRLPMQHLYSKLTVTLTLGTEFSIEGGVGLGTTNPLTNVQVGDVYRNDQFNMKTGVFCKTYKKWDGTDATPISIILSDAAGTTLGTFTPATSATTKAVATYECILIPQTVSADKFHVTFTLGGKMYKWISADAVTLDSGKAYTLKLTVGKDVATMSSITATEWTPGNGTGDSIETE